MSKSLLQELELAGIVLNGHFVLSSGLHSDTYIQCAKIFERPEMAIRFFSILADKVKGEESLYDLDTNKPKFDFIASPAIGGIVAGYELARNLLCRNIFLERPDGGEFTLRRGFEVKIGERAIIVEDVITTGKSSLEAAKVLQGLGVEVLGAVSVVDRMKYDGDVSANFPYKVTSLVKLECQIYNPAELPDKLKSIPAVKPGSRKS